MPHADWSEQATSDLEDVVFYMGIHDARPAIAERIARDVHALTDLIAKQPNMGAARSEFGENCRTFSFEKRWMVLYRPTQNGIEVVRFLDGRRNYDRLL